MIGTVIWFALTNVTAPMVMPVEDVTLTVVVGVRLIPLMVTVVAPVPRTSEVGEMEVITGVSVTVKFLVTLVPPAVVTEIPFAPEVAVGEMTKVAVTDVAVEFVPVTVMSAGAFTTAPVRFEPVNVTATLVPRMPDVGLMLENVGGGMTVKITALLWPPVVVTLMLRAPVVALDAITRVVVI